uniref:hypothetical protein n=1 Tax=Acetatifactor sp. TaxID=1872090 RepID=UPI0040563B6E
MRNKLIAAVIAVICLMGSNMTVCAAENAAVTFTENEELEYSGVTFYEDGTPKLGTGFEGIAPGEMAEQTITMVNNNEKTVDFYMNANALQALEQSAEQAQGAGYVIKLTVGDTVLYDSNVGGYASEGAEGSREGILEMNEGALEGYVLVATLAQGESENIVYSIFFDGEAMDNNSQSVDYSNAFGQLGFSFQVGYEEPQAPTVIYNEITQRGETNYVTELIEIIEERVPLAPVVTGDVAMIGVGVLLLALGVVMVVITGKKKNVEE